MEKTLHVNFDGVDDTLNLCVVLTLRKGEETTKVEVVKYSIMNSTKTAITKLLKQIIDNDKQISAINIEFANGEISTIAGRDLEQLREV